MILLLTVHWSHLIIYIIGSFCFVGTHRHNEVKRYSYHWGLGLLSKGKKTFVQYDESMNNKLGQVLTSKLNDNQNIPSDNQHLNYVHTVTKTVQMTRVDQAIPFDPVRRIRDTSKFTGLVVGASSNSKQQQLVGNIIKEIETSLWQLQSQKTTNFDPKDQTPATIIGSFTSDVKINFHGLEPESRLRHSKEYIVPDVNSLSTLFVLLCLTESQLYGRWQNMSIPSFDLAIQSLEHFQSRQHLRQSSMLTLWPEKVLPSAQNYINYPENIVLTKLKHKNTLEILENLAKSCNCQQAKSGLEEIKNDKMCKEYFNTSFPETIFDQATPPDLLTSSMNLGLGSLLYTRVRVENISEFQTDLNMWKSSNSDVSILLNTLKQMAVTLFKDKHRTDLNQTVSPGVSKDDNNQTVSLGVVKNDHNQTVSLGTVKNDHNQTVSLGAFGSNYAALTNKSSLPPTKIVSVRPSKNISVDHTFLESVNKTNHKRNNKLPIQEADLSVKMDSTMPLNVSQIMTTLSKPKNVSLIMTTSTNPSKTNNTELLLPLANVGIGSDADVFKKNNKKKAPDATSEISKPDTETASIINKLSPIDHILDSASYYSLSFYIQQQFQEGKDVVLIPTWISLDTGGDVRYNNQLFHSYNTIDLTTTASVVYTLVVSHIHGLIDIESDLELKKILVSSVRLLAWYVSHPEELKTFLSLSRFPSRIQFYWLVSRVAFQLQLVKAKAGNRFHFAEKETEGLLFALQKSMTYSLLESIVDGGLGTDGKTRVFMDDFIGVADIDSQNSKKITGDDRLFASALAINTLISTWTVQGTDGKLKFINGTDDSVRIAVNSLVNYVSTAARDAGTLQDNAFMTDQVKSCHTFSALYPSNIITNKDGQPVESVERSYKLRYGVKGFYEWDSYHKELGRINQGRQSSDELNGQTCLFHYWSSQAYTKAACVLAISLSANIQLEQS